MARHVISTVMLDFFPSFYEPVHFINPQIHFTQYLRWYSFPVNMRQLWGWEIERGRESTTHCRHIAENTEISILNSTKNCLSSSKPRLRVETNTTNMSGWTDVSDLYSCTCEKPLFISQWGPVAGRSMVPNLSPKCESCTPVWGWCLSSSMSPEIYSDLIQY